MKLSLSAAMFRDRVPQFMTFDALSHFVREHGLYPKDGKIVHADGKDLASRVTGVDGMQQAESRINALVYEIKNVQRSHRETVKKTVSLAENTADPYELHYMAGMFAEQKEVMRAVAKNQNVSPQTQILIARNPLINQDRETLMNLAHNPSITADSMGVLIEVANDPFVLHGVALNAVHRSHSEKEGRLYADICGFLAKDQDYTLSKAAIAGVKDPDLLREIADNNSLIFSPSKLGEVAKNQHTPDDVLERMSSHGLPALQRTLGYDVADYARHTLEIRKRSRLAEQEVSHSL